MEVITFFEQEVVTDSLASKVSKVKNTIGWHFGLSKDEVFIKILEAGELYLRGRVVEEDYKIFLRDKGFWHWFEQIYCKNALWLMEANNWEIYEKGISDDHYYFYYERKDYDLLFKYLSAKNDTYTFEPVLIAMHRGVVYDGRVFW